MAFAKASGSRPRKFIFFPMSHVIAHVSRCLESAKMLRARGHDVVFAAADPTHPRSKMRLAIEEGFRVVPVCEPDHAYVWTRFMIYGVKSMMRDMLRPRRWVPLDAILESQVRLIKDEQPDAVISAGSAGLSTAAHIARAPAALLSNAYLFDDILSNLVRRQAWRAYHWYYLSHMRNHVYRKFGVKPLDVVDLFLSIPLLSPDLPGLYEPGSYFRNTVMTGPIAFDVPSPLPAWYGELDDGKPNVYITMGSTGRGDAFLQSAFQVLHEMPYRFVVTTGGQASRETIQKAPANILTTDYAPGTAILRKCKAMVFPGGNGSMYQALRCGVPMLAVPMQIEQWLNARIAARNGFSVTVEMRDVPTAKFRDSLRNIVENERYHECAQKLSARVAAAKGAEAVADHLERIAAAAEPAGFNLGAER